MDVMRISYDSVKGGRKYQEDRYVVDSIVTGGGAGDRLTVLAVIDGHGGSEVADLVQRSFTPTLAKEIAREEPGCCHVPEALWRTMASFDVKTRRMEAGAALSAVVIPDSEQEAHVCVLGDAPVIIKSGSALNADLFIGPEHNVRSNPAELAAALDNGALFDGNYVRVRPGGTGTQLSRALGDFSLGPILNREPDIYSVGRNACALLTYGV